MRRSDELTNRQMDILVGIADGMSTEQLGAFLGVSPETVRSHLSVMYAKLHVHSKAHAVAVGFRRGWLR